MTPNQRHADSEMRYLATAWRRGFDGPRKHPRGTSLWYQIKQQIKDIPPEMDQERVFTVHTQWLRLADRDRYSAVMLKLHYRDGYNFKERELLDSLDKFYLS